VLVVEDDTPMRDLLVQVLEAEGYDVEEARHGDEAEALIDGGFRPQVALLDIHLPGRSGVELLAWLRERLPETQVVMSTGVQELDTIRHCLREGAYDYLLKPFDPVELLAAVNEAVARGEQVRSFQRHQEDLETTIVERTRALESTRELALLAMARVAESRDRETGMHLDRIAELSVVLARALEGGPYGAFVTGDFLDRLRVSAPLHDIGKVAVPDAILLKAGPLSDEEREVMRNHTAIGGDTLRNLASGGEDVRFLEMAVEIAYQHHERWDGTGYPRGLAGERISLAARIVALTDAYDAITSDRPYKRAFEHKEAVRRIAVDRGRHFDPVLVDAFMECHRELDRVRQALRNGG
jgi:putative two-component system response regulator